MPNVIGQLLVEVHLVILHSPLDHQLAPLDRLSRLIGGGSQGELRVRLGPQGDHGVPELLDLGLNLAGEAGLDIIELLRGAIGATLVGELQRGNPVQNLLGIGDLNELAIFLVNSELEGVRVAGGEGSLVVSLDAVVVRRGGGEEQDPAVLGVLGDLKVTNLVVGEVLQVKTSL